MTTKCLLVCYTHFQFAYTSAHSSTEFLSFNYGSPKIKVYNEIIPLQTSKNLSTCGGRLPPPLIRAFRIVSAPRIFLYTRTLASKWRGSNTVATKEAAIHCPKAIKIIRLVLALDKSLP